MPSWGVRSATVIVASAVPAIVIGNALWVLLTPWFVEAQYALPGFPEDQLGLADGERTDLAVTGLRSVRPFDDGVALLRDARLRDGATAFTEREIRHMGDVRRLVAGFLISWAFGVATMLPAAALLRRSGVPGALPTALARGGVATLTLVALVGVVALIDFEAFFTAFHGLFFNGRSWRFDDNDTLLQLYPETFWIISAAVVIALPLFQAVVLSSLGRRYARRTDSWGSADGS